MAVELVCPHCGASFVSTDPILKPVATCPDCGRRYYPDAMRDDDPPAPSRERRRREDDRPRRRRGSRYYSDPIADRLDIPAVFLMVMGFVQAVGHVSMGLVFMLIAVMDGVRDGLALLPCGFLILVLGGCKDYFVIRGAFAMRRGQGHGRAMTGAIAGCVPDIAWIFALIPAIWCLVVLNDPRVRAAFAEYRYDEDDDEDDF
jgi:hypothetical protein